MTRSALLKKYRHVKYLAYVIPGFGLWFVLALAPNLQVFWLSLFKWNGISAVKKFVGLANFKNMFLNVNIGSVLFNTTMYAVYLVAFQLVLGLLLALILLKNTTWNKSIRAFIFFPVVFSTAVVGMTWAYMFDANLGVMNLVLKTFGLARLQQDWLQTNTAVLWVVIVHIWQCIGYPMTLFLAGLQMIPAELYECASLEGASVRQTFFRITLPLIMPTTLRVAMLTVIAASQAFDYVYILGPTSASAGGIVTKFDTLSVYMFRAIGGSNVGTPAAMSVLLSAVIFLIFFVQFFVVRRVERAIAAD